MEQLLGHLRAAAFPAWMKEHVLKPLEMERSAFASAVPAGETAAVGHDQNGSPIPGLRKRYPEAAAAGLYTTPGDLARVIIMLNLRGTIDGTSILSPDRADDVAARGMGVDVATAGKTDGQYSKGGMVSAPRFDERPEGRAGLPYDILPVLTFDTDHDGGGPAVARDHHPVLLSGADTSANLPLKVADVDRFHKISSVIPCAGLRRTART